LTIIIKKSICLICRDKQDSMLPGTDQARSASAFKYS
jgi:hypothetical protein